MNQDMRELQIIAQDVIDYLHSYQPNLSAHKRRVWNIMQIAVRRKVTHVPEVWEVCYDFALSDAVDDGLLSRLDAGLCVLKLKLNNV
jgi:hypothetical protein